MKKSQTYEVHRILKKRGYGIGAEYFVTWKGYKKRQNSWESLQDLGPAQHLIEQFQEKLKKKIVKQKKKELQAIFSLRNANKRNKLFRKEKIQLKKLMKTYKKKVKKQKGVKQQKVTTFEKLLHREPDDFIKVKRNKVKKIKTVVQVVGTVAALQKNRKKRFKKIKIMSFSNINGQKTVRFQKNYRYHQMKFQQFRLAYPKQTVQFLLSRYNPVDKTVSKLPAMDYFVEQNFKQETRAKQREYIMIPE